MTFLGYKWNKEEFPLFRNFTLYSEIPKALRELAEINEKLIKIDIIGCSFEGRPLYLATLSDEKGMSCLDEYRRFMVQAVRDPDRALKALEEGVEQKVPVFINAGIHGMRLPVPRAS